MGKETDSTGNAVLSVTAPHDITARHDESGVAKGLEQMSKLRSSTRNRE
jgi:hypothetical protein